MSDNPKKLDELKDTIVSPVVKNLNQPSKEDIERFVARLETLPARKKRCQEILDAMKRGIVL